MTMSEKTPAPVGAAVALDLAEIEARCADATADEVIYELWPALVAEVRRLTDSRSTVTANLAASLLLAENRAESAEAEVRTLRAKVAAVEAWPLTLEQVHAIVDYLLGVGSRAGLIHGDTLNRAMGASARRRAALAVTTGEGE